MSTINGRLTICDRCGEKVFSKLKGKESTDGGYTTWDKFEELPQGWSWSYQTGTLCPTCNQEYNKLLNSFLQKEDFLPVEKKGE